MSIEEIKRGIASLSASEQSEVVAFLFSIRQAQDPDYRETVSARSSDRDPACWLTLEDFERRLDQQ